MLRAVIVDDERLARRELRELLGAIPDVDVVGEAETVRAAAEVIRVTDADAVFLDVQLGEESGFDLLPQLAPEVQVVFVTAFEQYAIRAFEQNAVDYLLKPVAPQRLTAALSRLSNRPTATPVAEPLSYDDFLFARVNGRMHFIKVRHIAAVVAKGNDSAVWLPNGARVQLRKSISEWAARLPQPYFMRTHRGAIVNLEYVERVEDWSRSSHLLYVRGFKEPVHMSRRYAADIRARMG